MFNVSGYHLKEELCIYSICIYSLVDKRLANLNPVQLVKLICSEEKIESGIGTVCRIYENHLWINQ